MPKPAARAIPSLRVPTQYPSLPAPGRVAAMLYGREESGCPAASRQDQRIAVLDLVTQSSSTYLVCDLDRSATISDPIWSPGEDYLAFNRYSQDDPLRPVGEVLLLRLADGSASGYPVDARLLGWMHSPATQ